MKTRLTSQTKTTTDTRGCEIRYTVTSAPAGDRWTRTGRLVQIRERHYHAMGMTFRSLAEMQKAIGDKPGN